MVHSPFIMGKWILLIDSRMTSVASQKPKTSIVWISSAFVLLLYLSLLCTCGGSEFVIYNYVYSKKRDRVGCPHPAKNPLIKRRNPPLFILYSALVSIDVRQPLID